MRERADIDRALERARTEFEVDPLASPERSRAIVTDLASRSGESHRAEIDAVYRAASLLSDGRSVVQAEKTIAADTGDRDLATWSVASIGPGVDSSSPRVPKVLLVGCAIAFAATGLAIAAAGGGGDDETGTTTSTSATTVTTTAPDPPPEPFAASFSLESDTVQEGAFQVRRDWMIDDGAVVVEITLTATTDTGVGSPHLEVLPIELSGDLDSDVDPSQVEDEVLTYAVSLDAGDEFVIRLTGTTSVASVPDARAALSTWQQRRDQILTSRRPLDPVNDVTITATT